MNEVAGNSWVIQRKNVGVQINNVLESAWIDLNFQVYKFWIDHHLFFKEYVVIDVEW